MTEELIYLAIIGLVLYAIAAYDSYRTAKSKSRILDKRFKMMIKQDIENLRDHLTVVGGIFRERKS